MTEHKKPLDAALDLTVYAPIGFALEARRLLPTLVERGRQQVTMAKMVGKFAVAHGQTQASARVSRLQDQAGSVLAEFGLGGEPAATADPVPAEPSTSSATAAPLASVPATPPAADPATLPIAGYATLAASQVIPRLEGLSADELDAIRRYEEATRGRKTILGKIAQLDGE